VDFGGHGGKMLIDAAVRYNGKIYTGKRHGCIMQEIIKEFPDAKLKDPFDQGFVDENGNYYHRKAARMHAIKCGQLPNNFFRERILSEDLW
jgi:hypothetical protein